MSKVNYEAQRNYWNMLINIKPKVVFSDEKKFNLDCPDGFQKNRQTKNFPEENYSTRHSGRGSLMIWCGPSSGKLKLQFVSGWQKAADYAHKKGVINVEKNGFFSKIMLLLLDHPSCSPNLSPKESLLGLIVAKVYEGGRQYSAISELKNAILDTWEKITSVQLQKLAEFLRLSKLMVDLQNIK